MKQQPDAPRKIGFETEAVAPLSELSNVARKDCEKEQRYQPANRHAPAAQHDESCAERYLDAAGGKDDKVGVQG